LDSQKTKSLVPVLVVVVVAFALPLFVKQPFVLSLIIPAFIYSVVAMGWALIVRTGQFSMGQAAFMTIGAYISALSNIGWHLSPWITVLLAGFAAAAVALVLGMVVLRLGGIFFAIVTLGFGEIVRVVAMNWTDVTKGVYGLIPRPLSISIGGWSPNFVVSKVPYYYTSLVLLVIAALVFARIDRSNLGRIFRSVASNGSLSEHLGIYLMKYRVMAFTVAAFFAGIAGALFSHYLLFVGPTLFGLPESIMSLIMCTVGGLGSAVAGPIMGAMLLSISGDYLTSLLQGGKALVFGLLVVVIVFYLPGGLVDLKRHVRRVMDRVRGRASG